MSNDRTPPSRRVADSATTMTEFVMPSHANALGSVFGGQVMAWIDLAAAICAQRHTGSIVLTAGIDDLSFERPIKVGQVALVEAHVTATFATSLEIRVTVEGEDATTGERWPCVGAYVTFVAVDAGLRPAPVRPVALETAAERAGAEAAGRRRAERLARRHHG
jgi:acyl-CoA hydrolase